MSSGVQHPSNRSRRTALILTALISVGAGLAGGFFMGLRVGSNIWEGLSRPSILYSGNTAITVLTLLDRNQIPLVRLQMERDIDATLVYLEALRKHGQLGQGSIESKVYDRLKRHVEARQTGPSTAPSTKSAA